MGAFNTVHIKWRDPQTSEIVEFKVQFKYGDTWQYDYQVGDLLKWGGNDIGNKDAKRVVVDGCLDTDIPITFPSLPEDFEVYIVNGRIEKVIPATGRFDFVKSNDSFIILEE